MLAEVCNLGTRASKGKELPLVWPGLPASGNNCETLLVEIAGSRPGAESHARWPDSTAPSLLERQHGAFWRGPVSLDY